MNIFTATKERLKKVADMCLAEFPQYKGYHDHWVLAMGMRNIEYGSGTRLSKGRYVLASPDLMCFYDPDMNSHAAVSQGDLYFIAG